MVDNIACMRYPLETNNTIGTSTLVMSTTNVDDFISCCYSSAKSRPNNIAAFGVKCDYYERNMYEH